MERLTWHNGEYWTQVQDHRIGYKDICARLAAYEDIGLTPEEVRDMAENIETACLTWFEARYGMSVGSMMDLIEAKQEGRLMVPPCKVGDKVYIVASDESDAWVDEYTVKYFYCSSRSVNRIYSVCGTLSKNFRPRDIGKTVFLTREEAEEALKEGRV